MEREVEIAGLVKSSLIDYPEKIAAVVFVSGCNFRCRFCHNPELVFGTGESHWNQEEVFDFLKKRTGKLDGVVITGGEPLLQEGLSDFTKRLRGLGYSVKLDTNGSRPQKMREVLGELDYVAMDIKNSPEKYLSTCGFLFDEKIRESLQLVMASGVDYEFRTTVLPALHEVADLKEIGKLIRGAERYVIQGFRGGEVLDETLAKAKSFSSGELEEFAGIMRGYVKEVQVRPNI